MNRKRSIVLIPFVILAIWGLIINQSFQVYATRAGEIGAAWVAWDGQADQDSRLGLVGSNALTPWRGVDGRRPVFLLDNRPESALPFHERDFSKRPGAAFEHYGAALHRLLEQIEASELTAVMVTKRAGLEYWYPERDWLIGREFRTCHGAERIAIHLRADRVCKSK